MGVCALILGIVSVVIGCFFSYMGWIGIICGVLGIIFAAVAKKNPDTNNGVATAGLVLSIIGTVLSLILFLACAACVAAGTSAGAAAGLW